MCQTSQFCPRPCYVVEAESKNDYLKNIVTLWILRYNGVQYRKALVLWLSREFQQTQVGGWEAVEGCYTPPAEKHPDGDM